MGQDAAASAHQKTEPVFPLLPEDGHHAMTANGYIKSIKIILQRVNLLQALMGAPSPSTQTLVDHDLEAELGPDPGVSSPNHWKWRQEQVKMTRANDINARSRRLAFTRDQTLLCNAVQVSVAADKILSQQITEDCDLSVRYPSDIEYIGQMDGRLAIRMVLAKLAGGGEERKPDDIQHFRDALQHQIKSQLPDGCTSKAFEKKCLAALTNIFPYLAEKYSEKSISDHICLMAPRALSSDVRNIKDRAKEKGEYTMHTKLVQDISAVIKEETRGVVAAAVGYEGPAAEIESLCETTGMLFVCGSATGGASGGASNPQWATPGFVGTPGRKWCADCDPSGDGTHGKFPSGDVKLCPCKPDCEHVPGTLWLQEARMNAFAEKKKANAKLPGAPAYKPFVKPTADMLATAQATLDRRAAERAAGKGGRGRGRGKGTDKAPANSANPAVPADPAAAAAAAHKAALAAVEHAHALAALANTSRRPHRRRRRLLWLRCHPL